MNIYHLLEYSPIVPADEDHSLFDINGIISICELTTALSTQCLDCRLTDDLFPPDRQSGHGFHSVVWSPYG